MSTWPGPQRPMNHVRDFLNCVKSRQPTVANPEVMYRSMIICLAADICEWLKRNMKFDLSRPSSSGCRGQSSPLAGPAVPWMI